MLIIKELYTIKRIMKDFRLQRRLLFSNPSINMKSFTIKQITMKKLLTVLVIGAFAACNGSASSTTTDSTTVKTDSVTTMKDSTKTTVDTSAAAMKDTTKKAVDSAKK
jgi:hypothetical protein